MEKFARLKAVAAPLLRINIDTDAIIPSREIKRVSKVGLSDGLFAGWRYKETDSRTEDPAFILNQGPFRQAKILLSGLNFGCGSSREHAVWALAEWGIRSIIAPSYGSIFYANCARNGVLPIILDNEIIESMARQVTENPEQNLIEVDLRECTVTAPDSTVHFFEIGVADREMLLEGLDAIDVTGKRDDEILAFQAHDQLRRPWIYL